MQKLSVFTDGGARGNPGPAAIGVVIKFKVQSSKFKVNEEKTIASFGKCIGETTNNVAEYTAVIEALKWLKNNSTRRDRRSLLPNHIGMKQFNNATIQFFLDSKLVVNQLNGLFKIKDNKLRDLAILVHQLETEINTFPTYVYLSREKNWQADKLVNKALDGIHVF